MKVKYYVIEVVNNKEVITFTTTATSKQAAINKILQAELCPESCIKSLKESTK